jgi:hypothetical protein
VVVVGKKQNGRTGFTLKWRLLSTQNDLVDRLRVLSQRSALQLSTRRLGSAFQLVMTGRVLEVTGAYG